MAFRYRLDDFKTTKNGVPAFSDSFDDGTPIPSAPNFLAGGGGGPTQYFTVGSFIEQNGQEILDSANGAPGGNVSLTVLQAILSSNIDPSNLVSGLKIGTTFSETATYDLVAPSVSGSAYGVRLTDATGSNASNDTVDLLVFKGTFGNTLVQLRQTNVIAGTTTVIGSVSIDPNSGDQIALTLAHQTADSAAISGRFQILNHGTVVSGLTFTSTVDIYHGENWTRAALIALGPNDVDTSGVVPHVSPVTLDDFSFAQGWGDANNPRQIVDGDHNGTADYLAFGFEYTLAASGGVYADAGGNLGPSFSKSVALIHDFGTNEGYNASAQRGAADTGYGVADSIYGQGFSGVYWYGATTGTAHQDSAGRNYLEPTYETSPHFYGNFGTLQGWSTHNGFDIVKAAHTDASASILGFGSDGIVVGPQAFSASADASQSYLIPIAVGNNAGWDQQIDVRTFQDSKGGAIDLNHDGITDFVGMGPQGMVFAFGTEDASNHYGLGTLQTANLSGGPDLGRAQGWTDANTLREVVHDPITGFDDVIAFGASGVLVSMGQDPATHGGQPFGQLYLAMGDFGTNQGWSNALTPRLIGDVNGDGVLDIVGFGSDNTFVALGSRDASGNLHFAVDAAKTIHDFGYNEGWDSKTTIRQLADVSGTGHDSLVLSGAFGTHVWDLS